MSEKKKLKTHLSTLSLTKAQDGYVDDKGRTDAEIFLQAALDGEIVACNQIKKLAKKILPRIHKPYKNWHYSVEHATRPVAFIERFCYIPSGKIGQPFILEPFERMIVELTFGFVDDEGNRQIQYSFVEVARKNGKTSLAAAIEIYMLVADKEGAPQCYNVATSKQQASLSFGAVTNMVSQSPWLKKYLRKGVIERRAETGIICDMNMGYIVTLSSNPKSLDGLDTHFVMYDELAAATDRSVFDLIKQSMNARHQPLMMVISTQGFVRYNIWDNEREYAVRWLDGEIEDDRFLGILFELDSRDEWRDESAWMKANPGLGTVKKLEGLRSEVNKAKNDPSYLPTLLTKDFNVPANQSSAYFTYDQAVNEEVVDFKEKKFKYAIIGFDGSETTDLTAATAIMMSPGDDKIYQKSMYWIPEDSVRLDEGKRKERDRVPYHEWEKQGLIRFTPGNKVNKEQCLLEWIEELREQDDIWTFAVGYDPWHIDDHFKQSLELIVGKDRAQPVRQGVMTLSQPMKQMKADFEQKRFINNHNPIDEWCRMNTAVKVDVNDNIQPVKGQGKLGRIDGYIAELCAYIVLYRLYDDYQAVI